MVFPLSNPRILYFPLGHPIAAYVFFLFFFLVFSFLLSFLQERVLDGSSYAKM
jgi:hypothetical protein